MPIVLSPSNDKCSSRWKPSCCIAASMVAFTLLPPVAQAEETRITIGTASPAGVYHLAGRTLCRMLTNPCDAQTSDGSAENLANVREGVVNVALAQSDLQHYAVTGEQGFAEIGADDSLRSLFSLHGEPFTLVVRRDSGIQHFDDLYQRAVNVGNPGSGQRGTMMTLLEAKGWSLDDFSLANDLPADQQSLELCHGNVDAMVYTVGHPNDSVAQAIRLCDAMLVDVEGEEIDRLVDALPYFTPAAIAAGVYADDQPEIHTFGVRATLVASANTENELIYQLVAAVFDDLETLKAYHPAFDELTPEQMISEGLSAPLHDGALRYYREQGWIADEDEAESDNNTAD
ncbi:TAXI family TRAP transporter solute-binding subunit [Franzmannia qiaohouensis]|uniref:TAXI family TRAP transporter solute-binding subunit n=1 Tax=Franzmannia qiaohouensis TaxID=1329370 RepID=A0ABU1HIY9_9GAMM|nr:TAXI family TRAP transporter solute-binding subunit [Halomonas qiaohouensis]MDR5906769.1 TAXI family TRAP transporter solute-binding subunit [Halomonas qiaohouensis]